MNRSGPILRGPTRFSKEANICSTLLRVCPIFAPCAPEAFAIFMVIGPAPPGGTHAYPPNCGFGRVRRRARRCATRDRKGAILLSALLAISAVLAVLRGGRRRRHRRDDRHRAVRGARRTALLLLRLLRVAAAPLRAATLRALLLRTALSPPLPVPT